ncbi:MAG: HEAT repeat domain-containing protein [Candidatus Helarchaeota archaeon]|nr:HEAT repeat domain-containing protein [Candidatus Helarchaeota archaeon]
MSEEELKVKQLIKDLKSPNDIDRIIAQKELFKDGINNVEYLTKILPNEPVDVQCVICQVMGLAKNPIAFEPIVKLFEHENSTLRCYAAGALGRIGDERAMIPLKLALSEEIEEDPSVRAEVAAALGKLGNNDAVETLIDSLINDRDKEVRSKAALALGMLGDKRAVEPLIERFGYDFYVQRNAAIALGSLKDERAIEPLARLLSDQILGEIAYYALASIDPSFLEKSKDEIIRMYKKPEESEELEEKVDIVIDLDDLLRKLQDNNSEKG